MVPIISNLRSWIPIFVRPRSTFRKLVECFSSYDPVSWETNIELFESGKRLAWDMIFPIVVLQILGSLKPLHDSSLFVLDSATPSFRVDGALIHMLSPYASPSLGLHSTSPSSPVQSIGNIPMSYIFDFSYFIRLSLLALLSPVTMDIIFNYFAPLLNSVFSRLKIATISRKGPDAITRNSLSRRVKNGRVIRHLRYDLYLPPKPPVPPKMETFVSETRRDVGPRAVNNDLKQSSSNPGRTSKSSKGKRNSIHSLIFFPGFSIHHSAYADVAARMSDMGVPVAVVSLEPLRLAHRLLGTGVNDLKRLLKLAGEEVVQYYKHHNLVDRDTEEPVILDWALGGHSMGGYAAFYLVEELMGMNEKVSMTLSNGSISRLSNHLVVWAAGPFANLVPNLRGDSSSLPLHIPQYKSAVRPDSLRVLIILASNDNIAKFQSNGQKEELLSKLPKKTTVLNMIHGGNHAGFGSYDTASKKSKLNIDGERDIPLEVQHIEACSQTVHFLLRY
mmetsp:Transcript_3065/g.6533  ORF Transcript_3065/g.6533 Transcript_3065/m.6533 type:complete len:503 (-) Transcript_3065:32-1540(-)